MLDGRGAVAGTACGHVGRTRGVAGTASRHVGRARRIGACAAFVPGGEFRTPLLTGRRRRAAGFGTRNDADLRRSGHDELALGLAGGLFFFGRIGLGFRRLGAVGLGFLNLGFLGLGSFRLGPFGNGFARLGLFSLGFGGLGGSLGFLSLGGFGGGLHRLADDTRGGRGRSSLRRGGGGCLGNGFHGLGLGSFGLGLRLFAVNNARVAYRGVLGGVVRHLGLGRFVNAVLFGLFGLAFRSRGFGRRGLGGRFRLLGLGFADDARGVRGFFSLGLASGRGFGRGGGLLVVILRAVLGLTAAHNDAGLHLTAHHLGLCGRRSAQRLPEAVGLVILQGAHEAFDLDVHVPQMLQDLLVTDAKFGRQVLHLELCHHSRSPC